MRSLFILLFTAAFLYAAPVGISAWQSFGGTEGEAPRVTLLESDISHMVVRVDLPGFYLYRQPAGGYTWDRVELPPYQPQGDVGLPEMPSVTSLFALPGGTEALVTVQEVRTAEYSDMMVMPRQQPEIDMPHAPYPFEMDRDFYADVDVFPSEWVYVDLPGRWSGLGVSRLVVNPFRFDPASGTMTVASSITLRVDFNGVLSSVSDPVNPAMVGSMEDMVLNWDDFESAALGGTRDDGVEYLFICTGNNVDWVSDLFETHHYLGLRARVETLTTPATTAQIRNTILNNYTDGVTRFACIVGTHDELPSQSFGSFVSDYYYACIDSDVYGDISVGRITGDSSQVAIQVSKIMSGYMAYDFQGGNTPGVVPSETVLAAHEEDYPYKYTQCCNQIAAYSYDLCDITFSKLYPPEGATKDDLKEIINNNVGTVGYRGHGQYYCWQWAPGWVGNDIMGLTNTFMPPVFNIACLNGMYQYSHRCISEAWQWSEGGASGNLGANTSSYTSPNHDYMKQIYIQLYDTGLFRVMEAITAATVYTINVHGSLGITNARMYIWFGDPAQDIWTFDESGLPGQLEIEHPDNIYPGAQNVTISVNDGSSPVEGVYVTLTDGVDNYGDGMTFYEEGTTDASGSVTLSINAPSSGTVYIGAWKHDWHYDLKWILIGDGIEEDGGPAGILSIAGPSPNPVTGSASVSFSVPGAGSVRLAAYDVSGRMVDEIFSGQLESGSHSVQWDPGSSAASGMYLLRLETADGTATTRAMLIR
ncbi:MAG: hypothetical protein AVO35_01375 [Candidatus Aegiribacteria sp. MLS_C]|nr:MAG: hypothetical protein AVO35_01375 [Candidatus Aegiribacteria sp. MLS_C]